ncbi:uncharacterized protein LOC108086318 [Drosophila ficusphila]|uniref:uncharacterized protein LOC108086318 n=1 Tax=Drosophila ficusphila TaxID=30025 RepID=UPI0007E7941A|nr:uncharacterized protein LOC108086318 [Drosophila ficusphila]
MEELQKFGLFIDDIYRLRVESPNVVGEKNLFKTECFKYSTSLKVFKKLVNDFCKINVLTAKDVDKEKLRAISTQNQLKTISNHRQSELQIYQTEITEYTIELERLKNELQYLQRIESEQHEIINNFFENH